MSILLDLIPVTDSEIDALRQQTPKEVSARLRTMGVDFWDSVFEMQKRWAGIHYLLTGTNRDIDGPLGYLQGGLAIGRGPQEDDVWAYLPHVLYSHEVKAWADAMEPLTEEVLRARFDPKAFQEVELYSIGSYTPAEEFDFLMTTYTPFRAFVRQTADAGKGLILYMT